MARLEDNNNFKDDNVEKLQTEVEKLKKSLKRKQNRKIFSCGTCLLLFILVLVGLCVWGAYLLAQSGLTDVPILTERFYQEPQPIYLVKIENLSSSEKDLMAIIKNAVQKQALSTKQITDLKTTVKFSEQQITALLREQITNNASLNNKIDYIQLAILEDRIELFTKLKDSRIFLTLNFLPEIKDNQLNMQLISFKLGNLKLPRFIGNLVVSSILENSLNKFFQFSANTFQLQSLKLIPKYLTIEIIVKSLNF